MAGQNWEQLERNRIFTHPRIKLAEDRVRLPDGTETDYLVFEEQRDYVTIIPRNKNGSFIMVHEHTYPLNEVLVQFPEGKIDKGEDPLMSAKRELREETGYAAESYKQIGFSLGHHRRTTATNPLVVAEGVSFVGEVDRDPEERSIEAHIYEGPDITQMIADGRIIQKNTLAAWAIYQAQQASEAR